MTSISSKDLSLLPSPCAIAVDFHIPQAFFHNEATSSFESLVPARRVTEHKPIDCFCAGIEQPKRLVQSRSAEGYVTPCYATFDVAVWLLMVSAASLGKGGHAPLHGPGAYLCGRSTCLVFESFEIGPYERRCFTRPVTELVSSEDVGSASTTSWQSEPVAKITWLRSLARASLIPVIPCRLKC